MCTEHKRHHLLCNIPSRKWWPGIVDGRSLHLNRLTESTAVLPILHHTVSIPVRLAVPPPSSFDPISPAHFVPIHPIHLSNSILFLHPLRFLPASTPRNTAPPCGPSHEIPPYVYLPSFDIRCTGPVRRSTTQTLESPENLKSGRFNT